MTETVHVVGASGRSGAALCRALLARGVPVVPVVRDPARWVSLGLPGTPRVADLTQPDALTRALADALARRDARAAERLAIAHIRAAEAAALPVLQQREDTA